MDLWKHDRRMAGNVLAAGLAFRLFLCLLPAALFYSAVIGFSTAAQIPVESSRENLGLVAALASVLAKSYTDAHEGRWLLVFLGSVLFLYAGLGVSRALVVIHAVVWETSARSSLGRSVLATAGVIAILTMVLAGSAIRAHSDGYSWELSLLLVLAYGGIWVAVSVVLPRRPGSWMLLLPGAVVIAVGTGVIYIFNAFYLAPRLASGAGLYGSLGVVSAIMFGLFILARLIVTAPEANYALWRRRHPEARPD